MWCFWHFVPAEYVKSQAVCHGSLFVMAPTPVECFTLTKVCKMEGGLENGAVWTNKGENIDDEIRL